MSGETGPRPPSHEALPAKVSLLAVGDTGKQHRPLAALLEGQIAVANDLAAEDRAHPADALLLLGDLFYMHGLLASELTSRIRQNLVYPYCHFVELEGPRSAEVRSACSNRSSQHRVRPIYAVLGNHDLASPESPTLERDAIPDFVSNWALTTEVAVNRDFAGGLSLIALNSESFPRDAASRDLLAEALRAARGPWRVIAAHTPMAINERGGPPQRADRSLAFQRWVAAAIEQAGVRVHVYLSGHHHSLQVLEGHGEWGPAAHVVVGGGARYREITASHPRRRYQAARLGFARLDLVADQRGERLVVSMFRSPSIPMLQFGAPRLVGRWSVGPSGEFARQE